MEGFVSEGTVDIEPKLMVYLMKESDDFIYLSLGFLNQKALEWSLEIRLELPTKSQA